MALSETTGEYVVWATRMTVLVPPVFVNVMEQVRIVMERNGYTKCRELTPKAGCRRFKLS